MKLHLPILLTVLLCATHATAADDPLAPWRSGVKIAEVAPQDGRHTIHSYFNTCPESPDGKWVLFFTSTAANGQLGNVCIRNRESGEEKILARDVSTEDAHRVACQQWASGGRRVVYHGERGSNWVVAVVDVATGSERILATNRLSGWGQPNADVVPLYGLHWNPGKHRDLELANVETGEIKTALTVDAVRKKYPDWLAKAYGDKPVSIFFPVMSPDLNRVFFKMAASAGGDPRSKLASERQGIACYSLADQRFLYTHPKWGHPSWQFDSRTINEAGNLLFDSDTGKYTRVPELPYFGSGHPSSSPDETLLVTDTTMDRIGGNPKEWGIIVADIRGTNYVVVHHFDNSHGARSWRPSHPHPVFSADGQRIYFNINRDPWTQLFVANRAATH